MVTAEENTFLDSGDDLSSSYFQLKRPLDQTLSSEASLAFFTETIFSHSSVHNLLKNLNYEFQDKGLLLKALTHSSFTHELTALKLEHNEKLEFLGDAILSTIISYEIFQRFPHLDEGQLSKLRGSMVNQDRLSILASFLGLQFCLLLGKGELKRKKEGQVFSSLLANALEALIAAIFLDGGYAVATHQVLYLIKRFEENQGLKILDIRALDEFDAKTKLQEITMGRYKTLPQYRVLSKGTGHYPLFKMGLFINGHEVAIVEEGSKKKAEKALAVEAIKLKLYEKLPASHQDKDKE